MRKQEQNNIVITSNKISKYSLVMMLVCIDDNVNQGLCFA